MQPKIIVVTGGVLSGLGKGIATASIGKLLKNSQKIIAVKCDGYLNVDPGAMSPIEHASPLSPDRAKLISSNRVFVFTIRPPS